MGLLIKIDIRPIKKRNVNDFIIKGKKVFEYDSNFSIRMIGEKRRY